MESNSNETPLLTALVQHRVKAEVIDLDHYRIRGGMAVETDYIIRVSPTEEPKRGPQFEAFTLSKTYSAFRTFGQQLKKSADEATCKDENLPRSVQKLVQYCETVSHLVETQKTTYLGKVNYNYVKNLAKKRSLLIAQILAATLSYFPNDISSHPLHSDIGETIQTFFLLDHCIQVPEAPTESTESPQLAPSFTFEDSGGNVVENVKARLDEVGGNVMAMGGFLKDKITGELSSPKAERQEHTTPPPINTSITPRMSLCSPVVPYTRKARRSSHTRERDDTELNEVGGEAILMLDDDRPPTEMVPSYSYPIPNFSSEGGWIGDLLENNPFIFMLIAIVVIAALHQARDLNVTMDLDICLLLLWASFCVGMHTPRPMVGAIDKSRAPPVAATRRANRRRSTADTRLLRMAIASTPVAAEADSERKTNSILQSIRDEIEEDDMMEMNQSPLPKFPDGAELGSQLNCWSEPVSESFNVRGPNYLADRVKVASQEFVFPIRAVDLFLTDVCPENAGSNPGVLGGELRNLPTFLINFRLPWGVLLSYFEIPERFLPFVRAGHEPEFDKSTLPSLDKMTPADRCVARWLQGSVDHKNETLKIVPSVVEGPWIVKSVVGGKPAIIGTKMPVNYYYQKAEDGKACYLEADLDIVASSAARGILSCVRSYTNVLTIDLGFVVQGNSDDELPEQMLVGMRLHGIDPLGAPPYPPSSDLFMHPASDDDDDDSRISSTSR